MQEFAKLRESCLLLFLKTSKFSRANENILVGRSNRLVALFFFLRFVLPREIRKATQRQCPVFSREKEKTFQSRSTTDSIINFILQVSKGTK